MYFFIICLRTAKTRRRVSSIEAETSQWTILFLVLQFFSIKWLFVVVFLGICVRWFVLFAALYCFVWFFVLFPYDALMILICVVTKIQYCWSCGMWRRVYNGNKWNFKAKNPHHSWNQSISFTGNVVQFMERPNFIYCCSTELYRIANNSCYWISIVIIINYEVIVKIIFCKLRSNCK